MKLNQSQREAFVRAVMQDVPQVKYDEQLRTAVQDFLYYLAPPEARALYDNPKTRGYVPLGSVSIHRADVGFSDMYLVPYASGGTRWGRPDMTINLEKSEDAPALGVIKSLVESKKAQEIERVNLNQKLRSAINSVSTLKQALELMPEFAKYLPEEPTKTKNLPAVANLVADLNKAGWAATEAKK